MAGGETEVCSAALLSPTLGSFLVKGSVLVRGWGKWVGVHGKSWGRRNRYSVGGEGRGH